MAFYKIYLNSNYTNEYKRIQKNTNEYKQIQTIIKKIDFFLFKSIYKLHL